jgi:hypothetical protein
MLRTYEGASAIIPQEPILQSWLELQASVKNLVQCQNVEQQYVERQYIEQQNVKFYNIKRQNVEHGGTSNMSNVVYNTGPNSHLLGPWFRPEGHPRAWIRVPPL